MEFLGFIKSILLAYGKSARLASIALRKNLIIIVSSVLAYLVLNIAASLLAGTGMVGGFVLGFIHIIILSFYYSWLATCADKDKLNKSNLLVFDYGLFSNIISVAFILFLLDYFIRPMKFQPETQRLYYCIQLGLFILLNAVCEVIYILRIERFDAISRAFFFVRDNWIEWFIPTLIIFTPWLLLNPVGILFAFASSDPLLPVMPVVQLTTEYLSFKLELPYLIATIIGVSLGSWFMIFRAFLFKELDSTTRRKRIYNAKI